MTTTYIHNIGQLATLAPLTSNQYPSKITEADLGLVNHAWLLCENGKVKDFGSMSTSPKSLAAGTVSQDAQGGLVMPGLVDAHTHPIFAGSRANEFAMRLSGATYQEIAAQGGGIKATMLPTRAASLETLRTLTEQRLDVMLDLGVTTIEVKSGYGLTVADEIKLLEVLDGLKRQRASTQTLSVTCLALHALPPEFKSAKDYVRAATEELLPEVAKRGLATAVDAFVENGYFSADDVRPYLQKAKDLGLAIRIHADEFTDSQAAGLAAEFGALSADHLQHASPSGINAMAQKRVTAVILPGTSLYAKIPFTQARRFFDAGCAVALATDFNPGSCSLNHLAQLATFGAIHCGFTMSEAVAAVTYTAACSLGLGNRKGALTKGFDADFLLYKDLHTAQEWLADAGKSKPQIIS